MSDEPKYTQDEVNAILHRALAQREEAVSHGDLVETAKEIGLSTKDVEAAVAAVQKDRVIEAERTALIERRTARLRQSLIFYGFVNALCLAINLLAGGSLWFYWVLVPWGLVLALQAALSSLPPSQEALARLSERRARRLRRAQRREQWKRGAAAIEDVVGEGVNLLLERLHERKQLSGRPAPPSLTEADRGAGEDDAGAKRKR